MQNKELKVNKRKFNIVDMVALIIIVVVCIALAMIIDPLDVIKKISPNNEITLSYVVEFNNLNTKDNHNIVVGQSAVESLDDKQIGEVISVKKRNSQKWTVSDYNDKMELYTDYTQDTIFVTIEVKCNYKEGDGYYLNGRQITVGKSMDIIFSETNTTLKGRCISIQEIK